MAASATTLALRTSQRRPQTSTESSFRPADARRSPFFRARSLDRVKDLTVEPQPHTSTTNAEFFLGRFAAAGHSTNVIVKRSSLFHRATSLDDSVREIAVAAYDRGGHPHIVKGLGAFRDNDTAHLVMEHCTNGDLFQRLTSYSDGRMPQRDALDVLLQVARGLQFLHQCNVAHRDISMENVLIDSDDVCKLCDFGLSTDANVVSTACVGKAEYMAPEVVAATPYDPAVADIWSLGVLFFMLLTGSPLVKVASVSTSDFRAFLAVGSRGILKLWGMEKEFSMATLDLLDGMLRVDPRERFASVASILEHPAMLAAAARH